MRTSILLVVPLLLAPAAVEAGVSAERLRQRVAEELLRDGISLERLGQELQLAQPRGKGWRVRLVDAASGEVLEQRMVDRLPAGQPAAVAELVVVVSSMVQRKDGPAARWRDTLPIEAVRSHLSGSGLRIAVVGAGSGGDVETAAETLRAVLREAGVKMVVGSETLGDLSTAADPKIVERAADLPVDEVHVLRLFPGTGSEPEAFVVTMYRPGGDVVGAYSGTAGTALDAKAAAAGSRGVSNKTAAAVSELTENEPGHDEALEEYEKRAVWFQDMVGINAGAGAIIVSTWSMPLKGKYEEPLDGADFYTYLGRQDLAESYTRRNRIRIGTAIGLGVVAFAGMGAFFWAAFNQSCDDATTFEIEECSASHDRRVEVATWGGAAAALIGASFVSIPIFVSPHPVDASEARRLADEFNKELRADLGISEEEYRNLRGRALNEPSR